MSNNNPHKIKHIARRACVVSAVCALTVISMVVYSHSLTPSGASSQKKAQVDGAPARIDSALMTPVRRWTGKKFIVLDKPKLFRKFGYELFLTKDLSTSIKRIDTSMETDRHHLRYDRCRKTVLTVTSVEPIAEEYLVGFSQETTLLSLYAKTHRRAIEGIASVEDLDNAAKMWVGRTVYSRRRFIDTYDSAEGAFGTIKVDIQERLTVTAVRWGTTPLPPKPLWLCVLTKDKQAGLIPVSQSWTNVMTDKIDGTVPWSDDIFEKNPMELYSWDGSVWNAINSHSIVSGMSKEQVRVSWGPPHDIVTDTASRRCREEWRYGSQYLCFDHDTVISIGAR